MNTKYLPYLFIIPTVVALLIVEAYPIVYSLYLSVTEFSTLTTEPVFIGFDNYVRMIYDENFWISLRVTLLYVFGSVSLAFVLGLSFAVLLFRDIEYRKRLQTVLILPIAISPLIAGVFFSPAAIWDDINVVLKFVLGLPMIDVYNANFAFSLVVVADAWLWTPLFMLVFLSVLQSIPKETYEAAEIHGASNFQTFRRVTFPLIIRSPVIFIIIALRSIDAFRSFEIPFTWAGWIGAESLGSPIDTLSLFMYKLLIFPAYESPFSYIATIALTMLMISLVITTILLKFSDMLWEEK
ncbi:MAG TPA: sugar ABC transporter permease [Nitrososphaerales archaeon]|nr:sugar ABC transporter permease [Nitrososphaerales archaeon]